MLGILVNCFSIVFVSTLGAITKKFVNDGYKAILYQVIGISAIIIGISTTINSISTSQYQVMFVIFLTVGGIIGQLINFDQILSKIMKGFSSNGLNEGLTVAISLLCLGSIPILGPLQSALQGDNTFFADQHHFLGHYGLNSGFLLWLWHHAFGNYFICH
ncbi:DUF554 family protein [Paenibacillus sp. 7523-1]|uniref:DUF554 family protein n=1 Tax=Paenibacillus sp. 7523-1 TaxID=2022550 RepID=UPI000BA6F2B6|nr:DUF554 family protein [Paenibacillus sp. 7523-1]PAD31015.1 hypothetical protein CHH60_13860 [Paenibacillus sp. 7523-1]